VYRELQRNRAQDHYCPEAAHTLSVARRQSARKYRLPPERIDFIRLLLQVDWSPEQIANILTHAGVPVSHEWIYRFIALDKCHGGRLYRHLRQGYKRYRKGLRIKLRLSKMPSQ
jgi:IS30 family transposase